ncbi:MAG: DUF3472 domain-containing protein [Alistipes sp.]|nr:DUF3472 domain-containing protein [Alistipes sp.]
MRTIKSILVAMIATLSLLACSDAGKIEQLTLSIPFKCNAYVTPLDADSKTPPQFADKIIVNNSRSKQDAEMTPGSWKAEYATQEPHQISMYFYTAHTGKLGLALRAVQSDAGESVLKVSIGQKSKNIKVKNDAKSDTYYVGEFDIAEPGYVRVNIEPISTTAESYPSISEFLVGGEAVANATAKVKDEVVFVTLEESKDNLPHFVRRGPSNHFMWDMPKDTEFFYNEVFVPEGEDVPGSYFMLTGGDGFYMGIQPNKKGHNRTVLFSVWDTNTSKGQVAKLVKNGEGVRSNGYSHEGSGVQNFYDYDWESGRTYATLVRVRPEVINGRPTGNSLYTGYFRGDDGWVFLAEIRRPAITTYYRGAYSFCENFRPEYGWVPRSVMFPSQWMRDKDGKWHEVLSGRFSCDATANKGLRRDYEGGVNEKGYFYLRNIGYINENVKYRTPFTRKATGKVPDVDLQALVKLSESPDGLKK